MEVNNREKHFIDNTEKTFKLTMLEDGLAREFLAEEYDSYENRVEDINNVVPMRRCLEKVDILELLVCHGRDYSIENGKCAWTGACRGRRCSCVGCGRKV